MEEPNGENIAVGIVKLACVLFIGVIILNGFGSTSNGADSVKNVVTITFTGNPVDGDTVTLDDNVFEFDTGDGVTTGHSAVIVGASLEETRNNLGAAVAVHAEYEV